MTNRSIALALERATLGRGKYPYRELTTVESYLGTQTESENSFVITTSTYVTSHHNSLLRGV